MSDELLRFFSARVGKQEFLALRSRLVVVPFKERHRGYSPAEFAQEPFLESSSAIYDELVTRNITQKMKWTVNFDGFFGLADSQVKGEAFAGYMLNFVRPAHLLEH